MSTSTKSEIDSAAEAAIGKEVSSMTLHDMRVIICKKACVPYWLARIWMNRFEDLILESFVCQKKVYFAEVSYLLHFRILNRIAATGPYDEDDRHQQVLDEWASRIVGTRVVAINSYDGIMSPPGPGSVYLHVLAAEDQA